MGMYTGMRFDAKLSEKGIEIVKELHRSAAGGYQHGWAAVARKFPCWQIEAYSRIGRSDFIPFGALSYMPKEWDEEFAKRNSMPSVLQGDVWRVICSLKNYEHEIEQFCGLVLPQVLAEPCQVTVLYEADDEPSLWMVGPVFCAEESSDAKE